MIDPLQIVAQSDEMPFGIDDSFDANPFERKVFLAVFWCDSEVHQSGFLNFFASPSCTAVPFVIEAMRTIGAEASAKLFEQALSCLLEQEPLISVNQLRERAKAILTNGSAQRLEAFDLLDRAYFRHPDEVSRLLTKFVFEYTDSFPVGIAEQLEASKHLAD